MSLKVISLFSGAGGMDIGFKEAGFEPALCVEQDPSCCKTLRQNLPKTPILEGDISKITGKQILEAANLKPLEAGVVFGGPPCQSFSLAGKRMGLNDPRGRLLAEFFRIVREVLPFAFVMENVKGMLNWSGGKAIEAILNEASEPISYKGKSYKYSCQYRLLNAVDFGAAQFRERVFFIGLRNGAAFKFPEPEYCEVNNQQELFQSQKKWRTVRHAIGDLPEADEPSETAKNVSKTIRGRIKKHGY
jgi:DNA (cytosine-5)-methyltransferase 1